MLENGALYEKNIFDDASVINVIQLVANGASVSGTIDVSINLVQGCVINGNNAVDTASGIGFGLLDFGDVPAIFTEQDAVVNGGSATGIEVLCSNGVTPTFTLGTGLYDGSVAAGSYAMSNGSEYIEYKLFTDSDRNTQIVQNGTVALTEFTTATAQTIELLRKLTVRAALRIVLRYNQCDIKLVNRDAGC